MSPTSAKLDVAAITRRMILPDRVFGMSGTIQMFFGRAILPMSVSMAVLTLFSMSALGVKPGLSETYISTTRPRTSSMTGTAAASALVVPEIAEAAAVPVIDDVRGRVEEMYVSLKPGFTPSADIENKVKTAI